MRPLALTALLAIVAGCSAPVEPTPDATEPPPVVECGPLDAEVCTSVAEAGELMVEGHALAVEAMPLPSGDGLEMTERYLVRLAASGDGGEELVEVVRFAGSENWSVRRLEAGPSG